MIEALAALLLCQLAGEAVVRATAVPVPGPVLGAVLLFGVLALRREVPGRLKETAHGLLSHLALLFVPAGTGVIVHLARVRAEWLPILAALVFGTALTIAVTAGVFVWTDRLMGERGRGRT